jgi:glycine cleavage system H protein
MTAGILSYQLCDRQLDCDHCPLDAAMRMHLSPEHDRTRIEKLHNESPTLELRGENYLYSPNHCWIKKIDESVAYVGLEPGFASILISLKAIVLPSVEEKVKQNEYCCWIILEGGTLPLSSPVTGKILATNAHITDDPQALFAHPLTHGWLFEIQPEQEALSSSSMMNHVEANKRYSEDLSRFNNLLTDTLKGNSMTVGATLADGGQVLQDLSAMLGPKRYFELVREVFGR